MLKYFYWCGPTLLWFFGGQWRLLALVLAVLLDHGVIAHTQFAGIHLAVVKVVIVGVHGTRVRSFGIVVGVGLVRRSEQLGETHARQVPARNPVGFVDLVNHQANHIVVRHGVGLLFRYPPEIAQNLPQVRQPVLLGVGRRHLILFRTRFLRQVDQLGVRVALQPFHRKVRLAVKFHNQGVALIVGGHVADLWAGAPTLFHQHGAYRGQRCRLSSRKAGTTKPAEKVFGARRCGERDKPHEHNDRHVKTANNELHFDYFVCYIQHVFQRLTHVSLPLRWHELLLRHFVEIFGDIV